MRKKAAILLVLICVLLVAVLTACDINGTSNQGGTQESERKVVDIAIDESSSTLTGYAGEFDLSLVKLLVYYSDDNVERINLYAGLIDVADRTKLDKVGTYQLKVNYANHTTRFTVKLSQKPTEIYTLRVYGGLPTKINNEAIDDELALNDQGYYENDYEKGTVVTLDWIEVERCQFKHWTDNDVIKDSSRTTNVTMDENHTYRAVSELIVNKVEFVTNCDQGINPRRVNAIYKGEIDDINNSLYRDGYVFDGWTTTVVTNGREIDNRTVEKINFSADVPYEITADTVLYGTWRTLGIGYNTDVSDIGTSGYKVVSYEKNDKEVIIPSLHENMPVIGIAADAFINASALERLVIPATVEFIEAGFVRNCPRLKEIVVIENDNIAGRDITSNFAADDGVLYTRSGYDLIAYPAGLLNAEYVVDGVRNIWDYAFYNAIVGGIVVSNHLRTIGDHAFDSVHLDYVNLVSVNPNESGFSMGEDIFNDNLSHILISASYRSAFLDPVKNFISMIDNEPILTTNESDLATIGLYTFGGSKMFIFKTIDNENSNSTTSTREIIGADRSLTEVTLPEVMDGAPVSSIGYRAFNGCIYLSKFIIPIESKLERILDGALNDTPYAASLQNRSIVANGVLYKYLGDESVYSLPSTIKKIAEGAFNNSESLVSITINGNTLVEIAAFAFYNCKNFVGTSAEGLTLKSKTETVGNYAFYGTAIKRVEGSGLKTIGKQAFARCYYLTNVEIGRSVTDISSDAFMYCYSVQEYNVNEDNNTYVSFGGVIYAKTDAASEEYNILYLYPAGKMWGEFNVGSPFGLASLEVVSISDYALFYANIASLYIPETVINISSLAMYIPGLISVRFKAINRGITYNDMFVKDDLHIGKWEPQFISVVDYNKDGAEDSINTYFGNSSDLRAAKYVVNPSVSFERSSDIILRINDDNITVARSERNKSSLTIPDSYNALPVVTVEPYAFAGYYLRTVNLGSNINRIASYAFAEAYLLKHLHTVSTVPTVGDNAFGPTFNAGMFVYILADRKAAFVESWSADEKYLIDDSVGYPVVNFSYRDGEAGDTSYEPTSGNNGVISAANFPRPTRSGYDFGGWSYELGVVDISQDFVIPYNLTLYCNWIAKEYTIIFMIDQDATMAYTEYKIHSNETYNFAKPEYNNHSKVFVNWVTSDRAHSFLSDGTWQYSGDSIVYLYPVWQDVIYVITYDNEGGLVTVDNATYGVKYGDDYTLDIPRKVGYTFRYWALDNGTQITDVNGVCLLSWSGSEDVTVHAAWDMIDALNVTLYYHKEDGSIEPEVVQVDYSDTFTFAPAVAYAATFCGWFDTFDSVNNTGTGRRFTDELGNGLFAWDVGEDISLYAQWPIMINDGSELEALTANDMSRAIFLNDNVTVTKPIGSLSVPFTGFFNGNGHTVTFNYDSSADLDFDGCVGLFAYNKGTIKNLVLVANITVADTASLNNAVLYVGAVAGINEGKIYTVGGSGASVEATISVNVTSAKVTHAHIGGLIGLNNGGELNGSGLTLHPLMISVNDAPYTADSAGLVSCGLVVGTENEGVYLSGGRSFSYYYTDDNDLFKGVICGNNESDTDIDLGFDYSKI